MNPDTLVVVHCYSGDEDQVRAFLPEYLHHECPVLLLSPEDAPVYIEHPDVTCRAAGRRAYEGQLTIERERLHLDIALEFPQKWFLMHDADSVVTTPELPAYLYYDKRTVWGNEIDASYYLTDHNAAEEEWRNFHLVYQPPWFFSRHALKLMLKHSDGAMEDCPEYAKLIDYYFTAMARRAGLPFKALYRSLSRPIHDQIEARRARDMVVYAGSYAFHSIKDRGVMNTVMGK